MIKYETKTLSATTRPPCSGGFSAMQRTVWVSLSSLLCNVGGRFHGNIEIKLKAESMWKEGKLDCIALCRPGAILFYLQLV